MRLLLWLMRASRGVLVLSVLAGMASGIAGVALIALIHTALAREPFAPRTLALPFVGLCLLAALARVVAQTTMARLAQGTVSGLCLHVCRTILALPLRRFEGVDQAGLLGVLTEDVAILANGVTGIP